MVDVGYEGDSEELDAEPPFGDKMQEAIKIIQNEHRGMAAVLYCLKCVREDIEKRGLRPDLALFYAAIDYIESFLDRFHHPKEDTYLFRALRRRYPKALPIINELENEHGIGESLLRALRAALDAYHRDGAQAFDAFSGALEEYYQFEWQHMKKEEEEILPLARERLTEDDWREIDAAFTAHDDPLFGERPRKEFKALFSRIAELAPAPHGFGRWES